MFASITWTSDHFGILYLKQVMKKLKRSEMFFLVVKTRIVVAFKYKLQAQDFSFSGDFSYYKQVSGYISIYWADCA